MQAVYQYFNETGALLYVGVTSRGTRRMHEHADSKEWWHLTTGCSIEHYLNRDDAEAREQFLIRTYRPPFNTVHNPDRDVPVAERSAGLPTGKRIPTGDLNAPGEFVEKSTPTHRKPRHRVLKRVNRIIPCSACGTRPSWGSSGKCFPCSTTG